MTVSSPRDTFNCVTSERLEIVDVEGVAAKVAPRTEDSESARSPEREYWEELGGESEVEARIWGNTRGRSLRAGDGTGGGRRKVKESTGLSESGKAAGQNDTLRMAQYAWRKWLKWLSHQRWRVKSQGFMDGKISGFGTSSVAWSAHTAVKIKASALTRR